MNLNERVQTIKMIQNNFDIFFNDENNIEENYQNLKNLLENQIQDNQHLLLFVLHYINSIANNHNRENNLFNKIERLLKLYQKEIIAHISNHEIFNIFHKNKRILLFLLSEKILFIDNYIISKIFNEKYKNMKYPQYFSPEIASYIQNHKFSSKELSSLKKEILKKIPNDFEKNRLNGENDDYICQLIQNDSIENFTIFMNKSTTAIDCFIKPSIFETNPFLFDNLIQIEDKNNGLSYEEKKVSLIEYACFYGSVQIFNYLYKNGAKLTPSLWLYSIHGNNPEIIHILENKKIKPKDETYGECLIESLKCHHNNIAIYIVNNYILTDIKIENIYSLFTLSNNFRFDVVSKSLKYYNFLIIDYFYIDEIEFFYLCRYDHSYLVDIILKTKDYNFNQVLIFKYDGSDKVSQPEEFEIYKKGNTGNYEIDHTRYNKNKTALITAVEKENIEIIKLLLQVSSIDVNICRQIYSETSYIICEAVTEPLLHIAIENENEEIVKLLLLNDKININLFQINNSEGSRYGTTSTLLSKAINKNNIDIVKMLLSSEKVDVNAKSMIETYKHWTYAYTALHIAVENNNCEMVKILLDNKKIDPNLYIINGYFDNDFVINQNAGLIKTRKMRTALHIAVQSQNLEMIRILLSNEKIIKDLPDYENKKPIDLAKGNNEIIQLLKNA